MAVRRNDVHDAALDRVTLRRLAHRELREPGEDLHHDPLRARIAVRHDDEAHRGVRPYFAEKALEGVEAAGRAPDTHDMRRLGCRGLSRDGALLGLSRAGGGI